MRAIGLAFVLFFAVVGAGCGFVQGAAEANRNMRSEDAAERELGALQGRLIFTLGGGTAGVLLLFFAGRWYLNNLGTSSDRTSEIALESGGNETLGVLTLAVAIPARSAPPSLPTRGTQVDELLAIVTTLRSLRADWRYFGARGTPPMDAAESMTEAQRLAGVIRGRVSSPPGYRSAHDAWLALVTIRAPRDFSAVMPTDSSGFDASLSLLFELHSNDTVTFTAEWIGVDADASLVERFPSLVPV